MHAYVDERTALGSSRDVGTKETLTGRIRHAWRQRLPCRLGELVPPSAQPHTNPDLPKGEQLLPAYH